MKLLCLGYGYTARRFVSLFGAFFETIEASARSQPPSSSQTVHFIRLTADNDQLVYALRKADIVLHSAAPGIDGDPFIGIVEKAWAGASPRKLLYLSTIGVYGDHAGQWVDENTPPNPSSQRSRWRLTAEQRWLQLGEKHRHHVQIFRLAGIYGPARGPIEKLRSGTSQSVIKPGQVFNRIHVDDIAKVLMAAIEKGSAGDIWNVADDEPAPPQDVIAYAAHCLGLPAPEPIAFADADMSPMARSFYEDNKRVSNAAIRERLGVTLEYPTYREGIAALIASPPK